MDRNDLTEVETKLLPLIKKGNCVVWVGSGLSKSAGYLDWHEALHEICKNCGVPLPTELSADHFLDKAEECKETNIEVYQSTLATLYGERVVQSREAYNLLMRLPFKAYVTTNFDPLLHHAGIHYGYDKILYYPYLSTARAIEKYQRPIFYNHGIARKDNKPNGADLIFARSDFDEAYKESGAVSLFIQSLLLDYDVIFIGAELKEPVMLESFRRVNAIYGNIKRTYPEFKTPKRFMLLPKHWKRVEKIYDERKWERYIEIENEEKTRLSTMDIEIIRYNHNPNDDRFEEVEKILERMCNLCGKPFSPHVIISPEQEQAS